MTEWTEIITRVIEIISGMIEKTEIITGITEVKTGLK